MRVIAGDLGGRRLEAPEGSAIRPTTDRVREAMFNTLFSLGGLEGAVVMDLFAGTGALGIEALSRGASQCTFVEHDRAALALIRANLTALDLIARSEIVQADALDTARVRSAMADVVFADPPYGFEGMPALAEAVESDLLVIESGAPIELGERWRVVKNRTYGTTVVAYARRVTNA